MSCFILGLCTEKHDCPKRKSIRGYLQSNQGLLVGRGSPVRKAQGFQVQFSQEFFFWELDVRAIKNVAFCRRGRPTVSQWTHVAGVPPPTVSAQTQCHGTVPQGLLHQVDHAVQALLLGQDHPGEEAKKGQMFSGRCW